MDNVIEIVRGTSKTIACLVTDKDGAVYDLQSGERLLFGVKQKLSDKDYVILKTVTAKTDGEYAFKLTPSDTAELEYGEYVYDIGLESGSDYYSCIPPSPFNVTANVTKHGDRL